MAASNGWKVVCMVTTFIAVFVSCFLLGFSFDTLEPGVMALMFNRNTRYLDCSTLYGAGRDSSSRRFFTGLGRGFYEFRFPMAVQHLVLAKQAGADGSATSARSHDGLQVDVSVAVQYQLPRNPADLCSVIREFGMTYDGFVTQYTRVAIQDTMTTFTIKDLWENRAKVQQSITANLTGQLVGTKLQLSGLQLLSLDIPSRVQSAIEDTTIAEQNIDIAELDGLSRETDARTQFEVGKKLAEIPALTAEAEARIAIIKANVTADVAVSTNTAEGAGYAAMATKLGLSSQQVVELAWIDAVLQSPAQHMVVHADSPNSRV